LQARGKGKRFIQIGEKKNKSYRKISFKEHNITQKKTRYGFWNGNATWLREVRGRRKKDASRRKKAWQKEKKGRRARRMQLPSREATDSIRPIQSGRDVGGKIRGVANHTESRKKGVPKKWQSVLCWGKGPGEAKGGTLIS